MPSNSRRVAAWAFGLYLLGGATNADAELAWRLLPASPVTTWRHDDVSFVSPTLGWVINTNGYIYKTDDGGASWSTLLHQPQSTFRCCGFADELTGWVGTAGADCFAGGDSTLIYRTIDGGANWIPVTNIANPPEGLCGMWVVSRDVVFASGRICGSPGLVKTTDGGVSWASFDLSPHCDRLIDCYFVDDTTGFVVGGINDAVSGISRGIVLQTTDGGSTWTNRHTTADERQYCWKISFPTPAVGYVSVQLNETAQSPIILKSTDAGVTWTEKTMFTPYYYEQGIGFVSETEGWAGGGSSTFHTTDGGDTWTSVDIGTPDGPDRVNRIRFLSPTLGYAVGSRVYKYSDDDVVAIAQSGVPIGEPSLLDPPRPNPFRDATDIRFTMPRAGPARVTIYDVMGREVARLVDGTREPGAHRVTWEPTNRPAGMYLVRLDVPGHAESRKLLLIR